VGPYKDTLFDIITDELKHASKYNYRFTLNSSMNVSSAYLLDSERNLKRLLNKLKSGRKQDF